MGGVFHDAAHQRRKPGQVSVGLKFIVLRNKLVHTIEAVEDKVRVHFL